MDNTSCRKRTPIESALNVLARLDYVDKDGHPKQLDQKEITGFRVVIRGHLANIAAGLEGFFDDASLLSTSAGTKILKEYRAFCDRIYSLLTNYQMAYSVSPDAILPEFPRMEEDVKQEDFVEQIRWFIHDSPI